MKNFVVFHNDAVIHEADEWPHLLDLPNNSTIRLQSKGGEVVWYQRAWGHTVSINLRDVPKFVRMYALIAGNS